MKFKNKILLMTVLTLLILSMPVLANDSPIIFKDTITVDANGGVYQIGFIDVEFKKDFLDKDMLPVTFSVSVYFEDGEGYIEFSPDTPEFLKKVHLRVNEYEGLLYDVALGENVDVKISKNHIKVDHFSRYCFWR